ncbi:MAG: S8 family serine peptidase [Acidobacteria bacterium]|nr:S8 family serine peptidase [Acidobacteriota bacterium]
MSRIRNAFFLLLLIGGHVCTLTLATAEITPRLAARLTREKVAHRIPLLITLKHRYDMESILRDDADLSRADVIRLLMRNAYLSQAALHRAIGTEAARQGQTLWITNQFAMELPAWRVAALTQVDGVETVDLDAAIHLAEPVAAPPPVQPEWNLDLVAAKELWELGYRGEGVVVAVMDSGADVLHPDLAGNWRGGSNSWFDPNGEHGSPHDNDGHGTQVLGLIVGGDSSGTAVGVAPAAQWIAVKIFNDQGQASLSNIHRGFQWLLDPDGDLATDDAPDIVNNSWSLLGSLDECVNEFALDIRVLRLFGIHVVFSAGNSGPAASTSVSPANDARSFSVGSVAASRIVTLTSSRGPSACDGSIFPLITAPGAGVRTSDLTFGGVSTHPYVTVSGTSFAAPHAAGVIALLRSAFPGAGLDSMEEGILAGALDLGEAGPDNAYGHGLLDALTAFYRLQQQDPMSQTDADGDGFPAQADDPDLRDCDDQDPAIFPGAAEIKHDGIDQDCNGFDLTIDILTALYDPVRDILRVEATSARGSSAGLFLISQSLGQQRVKPLRMKYYLGKWTAIVRQIGGDPGSVIVLGREGLESAATTVR